MTIYTDEFFAGTASGSRASARRIVPLINDLLAPASVVDVGCGIGTWLEVFREYGLEDVLGIDGNYVPADQLRIPVTAFKPVDLSCPFTLDRSFDLVLALEVAEHLPPASAGDFVASLCGLGSAVLFSAAIPFQGGTGHLNEQWPDYWEQQFVGHDFVAIDVIRRQIWNDETVDWWYAQNTLLFVQRRRLETETALRQAANETRNEPLSRVHSRQWLAANHELMSARDIHQTASDLATVVPDGATIILVDQGLFDGHVVPGRSTVAFPDHEGRYWGLFPDSASAIQELERLRCQGAGFIAFLTIAFWWLDHYEEFAAYLANRYTRVLDNERVICFNLHHESGID